MGVGGDIGGHARRGGEGGDLVVGVVRRGVRRGRRGGAIEDGVVGAAGVVRGGVLGVGEVALDARDGGVGGVGVVCEVDVVHLSRLAGAGM